MDIHTATEQAYRNGYEAGKKDAEPKWIPVSEQLPEGMGYVLTVKNRHYEVWAKSYVRCYSFMFTHWMPVPNPPTE